MRRQRSRRHRPAPAAARGNPQQCAAPAASPDSMQGGQPRGAHGSIRRRPPAARPLAHASPGAARPACGSSSSPPAVRHSPSRMPSQTCPVQALCPTQPNRTPPNRTCLLQDDNWEADEAPKPYALPTSEEVKQQLKDFHYDGVLVSAGCHGATCPGACCQVSAAQHCCCLRFEPGQALPC